MTLPQILSQLFVSNKMMTEHQFYQKVQSYLTPADFMVKFTVGEPPGDFALLVAYNNNSFWEINHKGIGYEFYNNHTADYEAARRFYRYARMHRLFEIRMITNTGKTEYFSLLSEKSLNQTRPVRQT